MLYSVNIQFKEHELLPPFILIRGGAKARPPWAGARAHLVADVVCI
jgi:hypothetical protein